MKHFSILLMLTCYCFVYLSACRSQTTVSGVKNITHYNVVIIPDLSNRLLHASNLPDIAIIKALIHDIFPKIARNKRTVNQKDCYRVILTSKKLGSILQADYTKLTIDLSRFKNNQHDRIDYLTGKTRKDNLRSDSAAFIGELARIEATARLKTDGADIWSLLSSGIDQNLVALDDPPATFNNQRIQNGYRNILILLTDGYIEAGIFGTRGCEGKQCRYLGAELINKFRKAYRNRPDKQESLEAFFQSNGYGITTVINPYLKKFDVLLLEADDRSLTKTGNATIAPTDFDIIKLFWEDWMRKSGVQHFAIYPLARDAGEAQTNVLSFMGIQ